MQVKSKYIPCGQRPMRGLRVMLRAAGMLLPMGPAGVQEKRKPYAGKAAERKHVQRKQWHERP